VFVLLLLFVVVCVVVHAGFICGVVVSFRLFNVLLLRMCFCVAIYVVVVIVGDSVVWLL